MKIERIEINNFGPFYGKHKIEFDNGVNITFGENGSGKTFLFKALGFALYGTIYAKVTPDVINRRYLAQGGNQASVTINFDLLGRQYVLERNISKNGTTKVKIFNGKGETIEVDSFTTATVNASTTGAASAANVIAITKID